MKAFVRESGTTSHLQFATDYATQPIHGRRCSGQITPKLVYMQKPYICDGKIKLKIILSM